MPYSLRIVYEFFNVSQLFLRQRLQGQHFLLSYFKTMSVGPAVVELTISLLNKLRIIAQQSFFDFLLRNTFRDPKLTSNVPGWQNYGAPGSGSGFGEYRVSGCYRYYTGLPRISLPSPSSTREFGESVGVLWNRREVLGGICSHPPSLYSQYQKYSWGKTIHYVCFFS